MSLWCDKYRPKTFKELDYGKVSEFSRKLKNNVFVVGTSDKTRTNGQ